MPVDGDQGGVSVVADSSTTTRSPGLIVFVLVAVAVSVTVEVAARSRVAAARSRGEAAMLSRFIAEPVTDTSLPAVLDAVRATFGMTSVALLVNHGDREQVAAAVGPRYVAIRWCRSRPASGCGWSLRARSCSRRTSSCSPAWRRPRRGRGRASSWRGGRTGP